MIWAAQAARAVNVALSFCINIAQIVITAVERNSDCAYSTESLILDKQPSTLGIITCF